MKVLLVQPPIEDFYHTKIRAYPLGILYLATRLKDVCHVIIEDFRGVKKPKIISDHPFSDLKDYYRDHVYTPFSLFSNYYRFGKDKKSIEEAILKHKPDVVAISSLFTAYSEEVHRVLRIVKGVDKEIVTVVGGLHPTLYAKEMLRDSHVDFLIRGEGETPLVQLIEALINKNMGGLREISGLCFKKKRRIRPYRWNKHRARYRYLAVKGVYRYKRIHDVRKTLHFHGYFKGLSKPMFFLWKTPLSLQKKGTRCNRS